MRVITNKRLVDFATMHPQASKAMQEWRAAVEARRFENFAEVKAVFNATDRVGKYHVFNIGGNKYRIIASIHFNTQRFYVREVLTHKEYDAWKP